MRLRLPPPALLAALTLCACAEPGSSPTEVPLFAVASGTYTQMDLDTQRRSVGEWDINNRGLVVGTLRVDAETGVVLWEDGAFRYLETPRPGFVARAINNVGQVLLSEGNLLNARSYLWSRGELVLIDVPWELPVAVWDLNDRGQVVGIARVGPGQRRGFMWQEGSLTELPYLDRSNGTTNPYSINNRGQIVGVSNGRPFLWEEGRMIELPLPVECLGGTARAINDRGTIVGECSQRQLLVWRGEKLVVATDFSGVSGLARDINERDEIVGSTLRVGSTMPVTSSPFVWRDGTFFDLSTDDARAYAINDRGEIVGFEAFPDFTQNALLWRPNPPDR